MATPKIKSTAVLIGYNAEGHCVCSEILDIHDYYDGDRIWDSDRSIKRLKLLKIKGYLFSPQGVLDQEFESTFDVKTGRQQSCQTRYADGSVVD